MQEEGYHENGHLDDNLVLDNAIESILLPSRRSRDGKHRLKKKVPTSKNVAISKKIKKDPPSVINLQIKTTPTRQVTNIRKKKTVTTNTNPKRIKRSGPITQIQWEDPSTPRNTYKHCYVCQYIDPLSACYIPVRGFENHVKKTHCPPIYQGNGLEEEEEEKETTRKRKRDSREPDDRKSTKRRKTDDGSTLYIVDIKNDTDLKNAYYDMLLSVKTLIECLQTPNVDLDYSLDRYIEKRKSLETMVTENIKRKQKRESLRKAISGKNKPQSKSKASSVTSKGIKKNALSSKKNKKKKGEVNPIRGTLSLATILHGNDNEERKEDVEGNQENAPKTLRQKRHAVELTGWSSLGNKLREQKEKASAEGKECSNCGSKTLRYKNCTTVDCEGVTCDDCVYGDGGDTAECYECNIRNSLM
jgi:hypothetical protein